MKITSLAVRAAFLLSLLQNAGLVGAQSQSPTEKAPTTFQSGMNVPWTGDLDGMEKRRLIRVLTVQSRTFYFVDDGQPKGIVYDAFMQFEKDLNEQLKTGNLQISVVLIPVARNELLPGLISGKGDIAAANLTVTPERLKIVDFTDPTFPDADQIVVSGSQAPHIATIDDLAGKQIYVRKSSIAYQSLATLNAQFKKQGKPEILLKLAPDNLEDEDMLEMLNAGLVKLLVVDSFIATFWKQVFPNVTLHPDIKVGTTVNIAWAFRKNSPLLKKELNSFLKENGKGTMFGNTLFQKYLKKTQYVKSATIGTEAKKFLDTVALFKKYGDMYSVDYLLMGAQGYQESRLDQQVKSPVGAIGVMQLMPATGNAMKVGDIRQMEPNIHAGIKYMRQTIDQNFKDESSMDDFNKLLFAFASYNAGPARIKELRQIASERGYNPNIWFDNVEWIASEKIGGETVTYVSNIYKYYLAYSLLLEEREAKEKEMQQVEHQK